MNDIDSKELLVVSDTHGNTKALAAVLKWANSRTIELLAFLGDGATDIPIACKHASFTGDIKIVRGNGDFDATIPFFTTFNFAGHVFFLCHGHMHGVNEGLHRLKAIACNLESDVVLFGHTHRVYSDRDNDLLLLNPGSLSRPRDSSHLSFATIMCSSSKKPAFQFWRLKTSIKSPFQVVEYYPKS